MKRKIKIAMLASVVGLASILIAGSFLYYLLFIVPVREIDQQRKFPPSLIKMRANKFPLEQFELDNIKQKKFQYSSRGLKYKIYDVEINSADGNNKNDIKAQLWTSWKGNNESIILVLPITGANDPGGLISWYMVNSRNYDALRISADRKFFDPTKIENAKNIEEVKAEIQRFKDGMKTRIINHFRLIRWARERGYKNIGLIGVSLGAIEGSIITLDENIEASVLVIGGGNIADILTYSREPFLVRWRKLTLKKCREFNKNFGESDLFKMLEEIFRDVEPLRYAGFLSSEKILQINSTEDESIHISNAMAFWLKANNPRIIQLPATHSGTAWYIPYIFYKSGNFFKEKFAD